MNKHSSHPRPAVFALALVLAGTAGFGVARAAYAWESVSAPCQPTGVAMNGGEIAVICANDRHVYFQNHVNGNI